MHEAIRFEQVNVWRRTKAGQKFLLRDVDWSVGLGEHWGIVGPNGAGKTTLLRIASAQTRPSSGRATVLGGLLGRTSMPELRRRIGLVDAGLARRFYPEQRAIDVVLSGAGGAILVTGELGPEDIARAESLLDVFGVRALAVRTFSSCSEGERARIMLARALVAKPELLVLDEPAAGLDLGARELLLDSVERIAATPRLTTLTVTHHFEELPGSTTHLLLLREGEVVAAGGLAETATDGNLSACFGTPLRVEHAHGRVIVRSARARA